MASIETDTTIIDGYVGLLENLSPDNKLNLISKLTESIKTDLGSKKSTIRKSFGAFISDKTAEEIIDEIRKSRLFTREIEQF